MLMVAPIGRTNLVTLGSMWFLCSKASMVRGSVAEDEAVPKAVASTLAMLAMNRKGSARMKMTGKKPVSSDQLVLRNIYVIQ